MSGGGDGGDVLDRVRSSCARVAERARFVRVDRDALVSLAEELAGEPGGVEVLDPAHHFTGSEADTLAFVLTLDAVNFGSGWFPMLMKPEGLSGYFTISTALTRRFREVGAWSAADLRKLDAAGCHAVFGQPRGAGVDDLMGLFATALNDLGRFLEEGYGGRFAGPVEEAGGSAARLVALLAEMPLYRDVARYRGEEVAFYKRAQLTAADLANAFGGEGPGRFDDLDRLTLFADNLVPHVLRCEGVLVYDVDLAARIDREEPIPHGCDEEIEIRALAVVAVEALAAAIGTTTAQELDHRLWSRGQAPAIKARPRHRTRCTFY